MLSEDAITKTDHADDCNPLATRVPGPRITPESVRRNPNAAMNEMHTDVAAAELPTSPRGLTLGVMPGEVVTLLDEGGRIVGLIGVGTIKGDAARLTFDVPADITVVRPMGASPHTPAPRSTRFCLPRRRYARPTRNCASGGRTWPTR